ncbi:hypothetical protein [Caballeronia grimmiae]|uniref:hypothetical protein n=1 Tax=Caballeronia grimmiae TaxID=1071679 RepID=UPI0038BA2B14
MPPKLAAAAAGVVLLALVVVVEVVGEGDFANRDADATSPTTLAQIFSSKR